MERGGVSVDKKGMEEEREGVEIGHSKIRREDREKRKTEMRARGGKERKGFDSCMCSLAIMREDRKSVV